MRKLIIITQEEEASAVHTGHIHLNPNQKLGTCEFCSKRNVIVNASGYYMAFICNKCNI